MRDEKAEIGARYHVVELLYQGKLEEAELSLNSFSEAQAISPEYETFYRFLLAQAKQQGVAKRVLAHIRTSTDR